MKNLLFILITTTLLLSCSNDPKTKIIGQWKEYYGIGEETDVDYNEIYKIRFGSEGDLMITCLSYDAYLFDNIVFDSEELSFRKENTSDPDEKFYIYGKLKLNSKGDWFEGTMKNSRGKTSHVKWEKIKNK